MRKDLDESWRVWNEQQQRLEGLEKIAMALKAEILGALLSGAEIEGGGRIAK